MINKFRYLIFLTLTTNSLFPYLFLLFLMSLVICFGMLSYYAGLFSAEALKAEGIDNLLGGGFIDAFWWSLKHVLDPGALSENYGAPVGVIIFALLNSMMGLALTGGLIGLIVNSLQNALESAKQGISSIDEEGHLIILGWNRKAPSLIKQFFLLNTPQRVVILSGSSPQHVQTILKAEGVDQKNKKILVLTGLTTSAAVLDRIGVSKAAHVIILAEGQGLKDSYSDVNTINSLMVIESKLTAQTKVNVVAEIVNAERLGIANIASPSPLVCTSLLMSRTMVQCARNPGYARVYSKLFSSAEIGFELFSCVNLEGVLFADACLMITNATVIGVSWVKKLDDGSLKRVTVLNPEPDYDLAEDDQLVVINCRNSTVHFDPDLKVALKGNLRQLLDRPKISDILIFSSSPNLSAIINELGLNSSSQITVTVACRNAADIVSSLDENIALNGGATRALPESITIVPMEFDLNRRWSLEQFDLSDYDSIFVLADESVSNVDADSSTAMIMLLLEDVFRKGGVVPPIVVELLDSKTKDLLKHSTIIDSVISTEFVSAILLQVATNPFLESIYSELINAGGIEMGFRPLDNYNMLGKSMGYSDYLSHAFAVNELIIGYQLGDGPDAEVILNPDRSTFPSLNSRDRLIVLAQQLYT